MVFGGGGGKNFSMNHPVGSVTKKMGWKNLTQLCDKQTNRGDECLSQHALKGDQTTILEFTRKLRHIAFQLLKKLLFVFWFPLSPYTSWLEKTRKLALLPEPSLDLLSQGALGSPDIPQPHPKVYAAHSNLS